MTMAPGLIQSPLPNQRAPTRRQRGYPHGETIATDIGAARMCHRHQYNASARKEQRRYRAADNRRAADDNGLGT